jgi:hypothetical protein
MWINDSHLLSSSKTPKLLWLMVLQAGIMQNADTP